MLQTVLVVDDEVKIAVMLANYLEASGFGAILASNGNDALRLFREKNPACVILDINMPGLDGLAVAREIRKKSDIPIIFLTARADETDRVIGLEIGGDDYVTKPFSPRELVARVRAVLRRTSPRESPEVKVLRWGDVELDPRKRAVFVRGLPVAMTTAQLDILALMMGEPGRVWTRLELLEECLGPAHDGYDRTIDAHVKNIRKALGDESDAPRYVETVRGIGYRFMEQGDAT